MKHILFGFLAFSGMFLVISNQNNTEVTEEVPTYGIKRWLKNELTNCRTSLEYLKLVSESFAPQENLQKTYEEARVHFKKIEFILAYLDPQLYNSYINGAPLPKLMKKVPEVIVIEPCGFQRLDELVYEDKVEVKVLAECTKRLLQKMKGFTDVRIDAQLTDPVLFEALRYGVLRMNTMGVTGFDCPGSTDKALSEVAISIEGMQFAMAQYAPYYEEEQYNRWTKTCELGKELLLAAMFDEFDRALFHKEVANPLWQQSLAFQKHVKIELPSQRTRFPKPVNYTSANLYSDSFLDAAYFDEFIHEEKDQERTELGKTLFFDPILSLNNELACASCHLPDKGFTDGRKTALMSGGVDAEGRNTPTVINAVFAERFFHDLRADRLSAQVDHVVFNPGEFDSDYSKIIEKMRSSEEYVSLFKTAYGKEGMSRNAITNAITRYVSSLRSYNSEFDKYMRGETDKIDPAVIRGFNLFSGKAACASCHFAPTFAGLVPPNFEETESEVLGVPRTFSEPYELDDDMGRFMNRILMEQAPFYKRSFKTPTIRNVELTSPYMHNGSFEKLDKVIEFYNNGGGLGLGLDVAYQTLPSDSLHLKKHEEKDIIRFMKSLTDTTGLTSAPTRLPKNEGFPKLNMRPIGGRY